MATNERTNRIGRHVLPKPRLHPWVALVLCCAALRPVSAPAADELKAIRHMVFKVGVSTSTQLEVRRSGIGTPGHQVSGGNADKYNAGAQVTGTLSVDVVAATADQGLVVDIMEDAQTRKAPRVRVGVYPNGSLVYDFSQTVNDEEAVLLRFLARGLIASSLVAGASFSVNNEGKDQRERMTFRVTGTDDRGHLKLDVEGATKMGGAQPYDGSLHGRLVYDQTKSIPILVQIMTRTHRETITELNTTDMQIDIDLIEDSFGAKS